MDIPCPNCEDGWVIVEEDGRRIRDACYHCANTGFISEQQHRADRILGLAISLATEIVNKMKRDCNADPESEGWNFQAAESRMAEYEYTTARIMDKADSLGKSLLQLDQMNPELVTALLRREEKEIKVELAPQLRVLVDDPVTTDDVPF
jgi:hypothetical protein